MKRKLLYPLYLLLFVCNVSGLAMASGYNDDYNINDAGSVDDAVANITQKLIKQRFEIVAVIDHAQNAANVGLELRPTQVILFRKSFIDHALIRRQTTTAIDIPYKILVYQAEDGSIRLKYNDVGYITDRHDHNTYGFGLYLLDSALDQFALNDNGIRMIDSNQSVANTVSSLRTVLLNAGFFIAADINYGAERRSLPDVHLLIFGNPNVGTLLMQNSQEAGLDLPQKFLVFADKRGQVHIAYNDPQFIAQRAGIQGLETLLGNIANALNNLASQGTNP